jgi:hypothetical protein
MEIDAAAEARRLVKSVGALDDVHTLQSQILHAKSENTRNWPYSHRTREAHPVWGDVVHYHVVQFARPAASFEPDVDRTRAIASRRHLLAQAAREGWWVAGAHMPFPGLGHVRPEGTGYGWVPAEFSPLPAKP